MTGYLLSESPEDPKALGDFSDRDWALLRLDRPIGVEVGYLGVIPVAAINADEALLIPLYQAGFSWDTGMNLSGNVGCQILRLDGANMLRHNCDTTHGDSGSPIMIRRGEEFYIIATESRFDFNPYVPAESVSTRADAWANLLPEFAAGRIGTAFGGGKAPAKGWPAP